MEDLRGREVYAFDETRIGTLAATPGAAVVALDPRLGFGHGCIATPFGRLRLAPERRLLLDMTPQEFRAAVAAQATCGA